VNGGDGSEDYEGDLRKSDELSRYLLLEFDKNKQTIEPLQFWKEHQFQFPFTVGWILNERRTNLQPDQLENILFVRSVEKYLCKKQFLSLFLLNLLNKSLQ